MITTHHIYLLLGVLLYTMQNYDASCPDILSWFIMNVIVMYVLE